MSRLYEHIANVMLAILVLGGGYVLAFGFAALLLKAGWHA